jgi:hypothetical protein
MFILLTHIQLVSIDFRVFTKTEHTCCSLKAS